MPTQLLAAVTTLFSVAGVSAPTPASTSPACVVSQADQKRYIEAVYEREKVSKRALRRIVRMRSCSRNERAERNILRYQRRQGELRRERQMSERCTPFGDWAIPSYIVYRESRGQNVPNQQGSDASGFYQIMRSTWIAFGGPVIEGVSYLAMAFPKPVQDCVAARIWSDGSQHWAATR